MKKLFWILPVALFAFTACNTEGPDSEPAGIAMILKNNSLDYWQQIESTFRSVCEEKGLKAYCSSMSSNTTYTEQIAAVQELRKLKKNALKGIIFTPCYGPNGENAEAEVADLAKERGIPVIILDTHVKTTGPLASCPFIGTDNAGSGKDLAEKIMSGSVVAFAKANTPGAERGEAFKTIKPATKLVIVSEPATSKVISELDDYDDFVFFNGSMLADVFPTLKAAGKSVYTFDIYEEFLDELMQGDNCIKGIMAQNTFVMARKAVEAVLTNAREGELVPTFYITSSNLSDPDVQPFLRYYNKK